MRLIGWAIALAAAGLTPAAAQTAAAQTSAAQPSAAPTIAGPATALVVKPAGQSVTAPASASPATAAHNPGEIAPTAAAMVPGSIGHMIPTPGIGEPDGRKGLQEQVTPIGREAAQFHDYWLLPLCAAISLFVLGLLIVALFKFRRTAHPTPSRNSHNTLLEVLWTLIPVLILVGIAVPSIRLLRHVYTPPRADVTVKVTGHQWYWSYELPDYGVSFDSYMLKEATDKTRQASQRARTDNDGPPLLAVDERLVLPAGKVIKFIVTADDVIHSFAVPAFWIKQDANPGQLHETWIKVDRPGVYFGQCSELCGARHGFMPIGVEIRPQAEFAQWVGSKSGHMPSARPAAVAIAPASSAPVTGAVAPAAAQPVAPTPANAATPAPTNPNVANRATAN